MNVSMQDGFNLGWKLASVLSGGTGRLDELTCTTPEMVARPQSTPAMMFQ